MKRFPEKMASNIPSSSRTMLSVYPRMPISASFQLTPNRHFSISQSPSASFDTSSLISKLQSQHGLTKEQAEGLSTTLQETVDESIKSMTSPLVTKISHGKHQYTQKVDFAKLKSEITLISHTDFQLLKSENERLLSDVERLKQRLREEIGRTQAGVRLDLNLEKGRMRDELTQRDLKIREVDARLEGEIAGLRTGMEGIKLSTLQWLVGAVFGSGGLLLAYLRMIK